MSATVPQTRYYLKPAPRVRYDKNAIYRNGLNTGMSCDLDAIVREVGGYNISWDYRTPRRDDDLIVSFLLAHNSAERVLGEAILGALLGPRGLSIEKE